MARGREDFTSLTDTNIVAQTLTQLDVDIIAQSIGNLAVDIAAQAVGNLAVNIAAQDLANLSIDIAAQTLTELAIKTTGATKVAVDIAAQTIGDLAVDIAAQSVGNLAVNIAAQDLANLSVDLAAQSVGNLAVNITAQDLANLIITIAAQSVGIYLQPEWAAKEAVDKNFTSTSINVAFLDATLVNYVVTAGKTLYITTISFSNRANSEADADNNQMCEFIIQVEGVSVFYQGANGGGNIILPKPIVVSATDSVTFYVYNVANHRTVCSLVVGGYEI